MQKGAWLRAFCDVLQRSVERGSNGLEAGQLTAVIACVSGRPSEIEKTIAFGLVARVAARSVGTTEECRAILRLIQSEWYGTSLRDDVQPLIPPLVVRATQVIEQSPRATIGEVAAALNVSRSWLSRAFRSQAGRSFRDVATECRVRIAHRCLAAGMPVKVVSYQLGYSHCADFSRWFRTTVGVAPKAWARTYENH